MRVNTLFQQGPGITWLTEDQCEEIHLAAMNILENVGCFVYEPQSLLLLEEAGARVEGDRVFIPSRLVDQALTTVPHHFTMYNREGEPAMYLEPGRVYFGGGSDTQYTIDLYSGERRLAVKEDVGTFARLSDALENIDFVMSMALPSDCPPSRFHTHQIEEILLNSRKPFIYTAADQQDLLDTFSMCQHVAGSYEEMVARPSSICYAQPSSPLKHPQKPLETLLLSAEWKMPVIYASALMLGASGPVTMAGSMVISIAESLSGLVIHQLKQPGAPFIFGAATPALDMRTSLCSYGSPEEHMGGCHSAALARYYKLPHFSVAGATDACTFDAQAGMEAGYTILMHALSGSNLIHDLGYMGAGTTSSPSLLILGDEMVQNVKYIMNGMQISPQTVALDLIEKVGPGGDYLTEEHTLDNFKESLCYTKSLNRYDYYNWEQEGCKDFGQRATERAIRLLENHRVPELSPDVIERIKAVPHSAKK